MIEVGKLYMDSKGFIYECVENSVDDTFSVKELVIKCWNPNDPYEYGRLVHKYADSDFVQDLSEVDSDYLDMEIRHNGTSIRYHMREAQQRRDATRRFKKELRDRGGR